MTEQPTPTDRAARARAARSLRSQQRLAARLAASGWTCTPPAPPRPPTVEQFEIAAAADIVEIIHDRCLLIDAGERDVRWDVHAVDADGFRPDGGPNRVTLICHDRPSDPVVVEITVRLIEGTVP